LIDWAKREKERKPEKPSEWSGTGVKMVVGMGVGVERRVASSQTSQHLFGFVLGLNVELLIVELVCRRRQAAHKGRQAGGQLCRLVGLHQEARFRNCLERGVGQCSLETTLHLLHIGVVSVLLCGERGGVKQRSTRRGEGRDLHTLPERT